ncbi:MAG: GntP family permease [Rubritepida sp.]|jgi:H+/gluconate symporter-like permease|nr:GntP family permease [Rubritepida sp.]MCU0944238.1 GntP family permease [Rubritepida sp.]
MGLLGILLGLGLLVGLAFRGWSVLLLTPLAALVAAAFSGVPLLASWTQLFMPAAAGFVASFFPLFLLGAVFGKLMDDTGSITAIARWMKDTLGVERTILSVVLAGALVTYGGVNLFVALFVLVPMAIGMFREAGLPRRLIPPTVGLGSMTFTMSALPGTPAVQNAIPMPFFGTTPFAAPGLGLIGAAIMLGFGLWWLARAEARARAAGEGFGDAPPPPAPDEGRLREVASTAREFDPAEATRGAHAPGEPPFWLAAAPLGVVIVVNLVMSFAVLPALDTGFLAEPLWGGTTLASVAGIWSVAVALLAGILVLVLGNAARLPKLRDTLDAGANASALPILSVASLVGFGAVVAALPAFQAVQAAVLNLGGGPVVSLAVATNILAALTGSASGGMTIALDALGATFLEIARVEGIDPGLLHRVAVMSAGTLDALPHNGAVVTLLAVAGVTHRDSYGALFMVLIVGSLLALGVVVALGSLLGSF